MAGYTRQSLATIINGADITAPPLNSEFNQILAAFNATTGHAHDGSTGNAPKINLTTSVSGYLPAAHGGIGGKNKFDATSAPATSNDAGEGYAPGSMWENTTNGRMYICVGNTSNAAVWRELVTVISDNQITPISTDSIDLGTPSIRFQDAYLSGGLSAAGNISAGGNLIVTGTAAVTGDATFANLSATGTTTITSVDLNSGAIDNSAIGTTTPAAGTFTTLAANTSLTAATADINGGSIDNATIGSSTPSTASFTTLGASGTSTLATVDINAGNIDNTVIGASTAAAGSFTTISSTGNATLATADINGGSIDGAVIGANSAAAITGTTITGTSFVGPITGAVTGNVTGNVTGAVTGNVTGDLTGNVTAGSGSSSFNNVTISGTLNMDANSAATITNLSAPTNNNDAARKIDIDNAVANLVDSAPDSLNTLNELAAALNDDDDAFNTLNTAIGTKLPKAGGTMTGAIAMGTNKITGAGDPTAAQDLSTKSYTDTQRDTRVAKSGDSMSGALAMGSNKITGLGTPTAGTDATTKTYVDNILGSATVASTSASNAATSESNAATSATNASNSATAAANSATSAAASLDSFDDRYLGAKSSAPTVDNDGDALIVGALYFDSTAGAMKVYSANGWTNAGSSVNGTTNRYSYTATAGQTVFAATYDAGYVDVFLNGVKQLVGTDVTATSGTSVVFASGTTVNDIVEIVGYGTFVLADHLTQTQSDARYVNLSGDTMTGALGIGTTSPDLKLDVSHNVSSEYVATFQNTADNLELKIGTTSGLLNIQGANASNNAAYNIALNAEGGNVGIGASSPENPLHVFNSTATSQILVQGDSNDASIKLNKSGQTFVIGIDATDDSFRIADNPTLGTNDRLVIDSSGHVGIGRSAPSHPLHIGDTSGNTILELQRTNTNSSGTFGAISFTASDDHSVAAIHASADGDNEGADLIFRTTSAASENNYFNSTSERMRIESSGAVVINNSGGDAQLYLGGTSGTSRMYLARSGADSFLWNVSNGNIKFGTNNEERMRITSTGSVLEVKGNSTVRNTITDTMTVNGGTAVAHPYSGFGFGIQFKGDDYSNVQRNYGAIYTVMDDHTSSTTTAGDAGFQSRMDFYINRGGTSTTDPTQQMFIKSDGDVHITDGNLVVANGHGIDFSATGDGSGTMSSELLDDYEEGSYQPTVYGATTAGSTALNGSWNTLHYTKIGRQVTIQGEIRLSGSPSGAGGLRITLPFTNMYTEGSEAVGSIQFWNANFDNNAAWVSVNIPRGAAHLQFKETTDNATSETPMDITDLGSNAELTIGVTYFVA